jgi:cell division protein FtsA
MKKENTNQVAILEIGSEKITGIVGTNGVNGQLFITAKHEMPFAGFASGKFNDTDDLKLVISQILGDLEDSAGFKIKKIFVGVPAEFISVRVGEAKQGYAKQKSISSKKIEQICNIAYSGITDGEYSLINKGAIDFLIDEKIRTMKPNKTKAKRFAANVSFVFCQTTFIEIIAKIFADLLIDQVELISSTLAQGLYLFSEEERANNQLLIDVGYSTTSVSIIRGEGLINLSSFSVGGNDITNYFADCFDLADADAELIKRQILLSVNPKEDATYDASTDGKMVRINAETANNIVKSFIEIISKNLHRIFKKFFIVKKNIRTVYLTGGGLAPIFGAADYLSKSIAYNVETKKCMQLDAPNLTDTGEYATLYLALHMDN